MADERMYPRTQGDVEAEAAAAQYAAEHGAPQPERISDIGDEEKIGGEAIEASQRLIRIPVEVGHVEGTDIPVIDKRTVTPEGVEAEFQAEKTAEEERLRAPLSHDEHVKLVESLQGIASAALKKGEEKDSGLTLQQVDDLRGDSYAVSRLQQLLRGESVLGLKPDATNPAAIEDVLKRGVDSLAHAEKFSVEGVIHNEGYDGGNLYQLARAKQLWEDINEADPKAIRQGALEAKEGSDWAANVLLSEPVRATRTAVGPERP